MKRVFSSSGAARRFTVGMCFFAAAVCFADVEEKFLTTKDFVLDTPAANSEAPILMNSGMLWGGYAHATGLSEPLQIQYKNRLTFRHSCGAGSYAYTVFPEAIVLDRIVFRVFTQKNSQNYKMMLRTGPGKWYLSDQAYYLGAGTSGVDHVVEIAEWTWTEITNHGMLDALAPNDEAPLELGASGLRINYFTVDGGGMYRAEYIQGDVTAFQWFRWEGDDSTSFYQPSVEQAVVSGQSQCTFRWTALPDPEGVLAIDPAIKKHYVYAGDSSDPNMVLLGDLDVLNYADPNLAFGPVNLAMNSTYRWQVEAGYDDGQGGVFPAGDPNNVASPVWVFETLKTVPVILNQPTDVELESAQLGQTAPVFFVEAESMSSATYQWYKTETGVIDLLLDTPVASGTGPELILPNLQLSDQGFYYCMITNAATEPIGSEPAILTNVVKLSIRHLMAHWTFDASDYAGGQYLDISGNYRHADPNDSLAAGDSFVEGVVGEGISINDASRASVSGWNPNALSDEVTFSMWVKITGTLTNQQGIISKRSADGNNGWGIFARAGDAPGGHPGDNYIRFNVWRNGSVISVLWSDQDALVPNEWVHITVTVDGEGRCRLYSNGILCVHSLQNSTIDNWSMGDAIADPIRLGDMSGGSLLPGQLDDVRIYSYGMDKYGVAELYYDGSGNSVCISEYENGLDLNGDCVVDLADLSEFAASWLSCGLYPVCQ